MRKVSDVVVNVFLLFGLLGFLAGVTAPIVGFLWAIVEWVR